MNYKAIPGFDSYLIDQDGNVKSKLTGKILKPGFLKIGEQVVFSIILRGIAIGDKQETQIVLKKPIKPSLALTKDHPLLGVEWIRKDSHTPK